MKKIITLATILVSSLPLAVQAQETTDKYQNYQVGCNSGAVCDDFEINYEQQSDEIAQYERRTRPQRTRSSSDKKIYAGGTLGLFLPGEIEDFEVGVTSGNVSDLQTVDPGTGFGGSLYGGYKFTDMIGVDVEGFVFGGDSDPLDSSYTSYGFFVNPRFMYSFNPDNFKSFYVFASPGIGVAGINFGGDLSDSLGDDNDSGSGLALQAKVGAGYPISETIDLIGQVRYFNAFSVVEVTQFGVNGEVSETEDKGFSSLGLEIGANFKF